MSEQGQGGKKGKGRGKRHRGRRRGGQQQQQRESDPAGGLQQRRDAQQEATALQESQEQSTTETKQPQSQQQTQKQTRKQRRQHLQRQSESPPEVPKPQRDEKASGGPEPPKEEPQGAEALPVTQKRESVEKKQQQGQQQSMKQQQGKQQPKHPDKTDGAGPSKSQEHFPTAPTGARAQFQPPQSTPPQSDTRAQPSMQPPPSTIATKPGPPQHPQPPHGAVKPDSSSRKGDSPPRPDAPKPPQRPDDGDRSGRPITLCANFPSVKRPGNDIYHYDTAIAAKGKKSGEGYTKSEAPRIIREVVKMYEKENPSGPKLAYDKNGKNIFCKKPIPGIDTSHTYTLQFMMDNGREQEFTVEVKPAGKVSLFYLNEVLEGKYTEVPYDTMQAIPGSENRKF